MTTADDKRMTNPTSLSPAANAVMIAAANGNINVVNDPVYKQCIAAALRAAARQLAQIPIVIGEPLRGNIAKNAALIRVADLLAIVNELENHQ